MSQQLDREVLLRVFQQGEKPRALWRVGTEQERFGLYGNGRPVSYEGPGSLTELFSSLVAHHGWAPSQEFDGGPVIALTKGAAALTLEPGGQLEISGAPHGNLQDASAEIQSIDAQLREVSEPLDLHWVGLGFHPWAQPEELPWVPKTRYAVMRQYLPTRSSRGLDMMQRTATVQANFDFSCPVDAMRKLRLALKAQPLATAMFAYSPWYEGKSAGGVCERSRVWLNMDPDRSGLLPFLWSDAAPQTYDPYLEWALDAPMFLVRRGSLVIHNTGQTFRQFMKDGYDGTQATEEDWIGHLNTLFPEARLKSTLEMRGADSQSGTRVLAVPALWKGIFYDSTALEQAETLFDALSLEEAETFRKGIHARGLRTPLMGKPALERAQALLEIAQGGLDRLAEPGVESERRFLEPMQTLLMHGQTPADALLEELQGSHRAPTLAELLQARSFQS